PPSARRRGIRSRRPRSSCSRCCSRRSRRCAIRARCWPRSRRSRRARCCTRSRGASDAEMDGNPFLLAAAPVVGFAAGFVNTLAGMGSLLTLPLLILLGLPANVANGTNRVGVVAQNIIAVTTFRRRGALDVEGSLGLTAASVLGAIAGAALAVDLDETLLRRTTGVPTLVILPIMLLRPDRFIEARAGAWSLPKWARIALFV